MRHIARHAFALGLGIAVAGIGTLPALEARADDRRGGDRQEEPAEGTFQPWGTWILRMQLPQPPAGPGGDLPMVLTIHREGTAVSSSSLVYGGLPPFANWSSSVHDVWERMGARTIESTCLSLSFNPGTAATQPGRLLGFVRNRLRLEALADGDHLAGEVNSEFLACPTPTTCPDVNDPAAPWVPRLVDIPVTADRLVRVAPGPLVP